MSHHLVFIRGRAWRGPSPWPRGSVLLARLQPYELDNIEGTTQWDPIGDPGALLRRWTLASYFARQEHRSTPYTEEG